MPLAMTFDERYRAIDARDARFDGQFVTAVRSTGIYCRPSCPARTPRPQNVAFYPTSAAAHEAGYRACKRCLPEAAPGSPDWDVRGDAAGRAMRLISEGVVEREGVAGLARRLGYSDRQVRRLLLSELGAGPLALARAQRAHTARMLLVGTALPAADVAFSAGFSSVRQFNDTIREVFDLTPTALRARGRARASEERATDASGWTSVDLALPYRPPIDPEWLFSWMRMHIVGGVEEAGERSFCRTLRMPGGPAWFEVAADEASVGESSAGRAAEAPTLRVRARVSHLGDLGGLVARVRRLFDLDADPVAIDRALGALPELAPLVARHPGVRMPGTVDAHENLLRTILGQQVSLASARTALTRLTDALGDTVALPVGAGEEPRTARLFPTMAVIAERGHEVLRGPGARIRAAVGAAGALASGALELSSGDDADEQRAALVAQPGIGAWTADYTRMRVLGHPDITLPGDVAVRAGAARAGIPSDAKGYAAWAPRAAPWRSYLTAHLWRAATIGAEPPAPENGPESGPETAAPTTPAQTAPTPRRDKEPA